MKNRMWTWDWRLEKKSGTWQRFDIKKGPITLHLSFPHFWPPFQAIRVYTTSLKHNNHFLLLFLYFSLIPFSTINTFFSIFPLMENHQPSYNSRFRRVCVFCGSSPGKNPSYQLAAIQLGQQLVRIFLLLLLLHKGYDFASLFFR